MILTLTIICSIVQFVWTLVLIQNTPPPKLILNSDDVLWCRIVNKVAPYTLIYISMFTMDFLVFSIVMVSITK